MTTNPIFWQMKTINLKDEKQPIPWQMIANHKHWQMTTLYPDRWQLTLYHYIWRPYTMTEDNQHYTLTTTTLYFDRWQTYTLKDDNSKPWQKTTTYSDRWQPCTLTNDKQPYNLTNDSQPNPLTDDKLIPTQMSTEYSHKLQPTIYLERWLQPYSLHMITLYPEKWQPYTLTANHTIPWHITTNPIMWQMTTIYPGRWQ